MTHRDEPMLDAGGDVGMSRLVSRSLKTLADSGVDPGLKKQLTDIAGGRGSLHDLLLNESFMRISDAVIPDALAETTARSPAENKRLAEQGEAVVDAYRREDPDATGPEETRDRAEEPAPPPTRPTAPEPARPPEQAENTAPRPAGDRRQSWRDVVVTPDEPDEDDLYFQERRRHGWLE